ncbi:MAG: maleylacetoacetate isomerase [Sandaracinaceae bacterium]
MKLHGYWRSSCTYRVRIALELKGVTYTVVPVPLLQNRQLSAAHLALNPSGQVPALEVGTPSGTVALGQSIAILEYLEDSHPDPALLPAEPVMRARCRQLTEVVNSGIQPLQNLSVMKRLKEGGIEPRAWCRDAILDGLKAYAAVAEPTRGRFSVGDAPTFADCALVPQLYNARRFDIDVASELPALAAIDAACAELDAFRAAHPDQQPDAA